MSTVAVITVATDHLAASINRAEDGERFSLSWSDYVANDWTETFPTLDVAVARLALLLNEQVGIGEQMFAYGPDAFAAAWGQFTIAALR